MLRTWWNTAWRYGKMWGIVAALACGDSEASGPVTAPVAVASVELAPATASVLEGRQVTLVATPRDANNRSLERPVTWASSNTAIATVTATGMVTGIAAGQVTITATSEGKQGTALVDVARIPVAEVRLSADDEVQLAWNGSTRLVATAHDAGGQLLPGRAVTWQSSRPAVVTVAADGTLQAQAPGTANVSAVIEGRAATVGVRVAPVPVKSIAIDAAADGMETGETAIVGVTLIGENDLPIQRTVQWSSNAPAIASVESNNPMLAAVQAVGWGRVTITATVDDRSASYTFTVTPRPAYDLIYSRTPLNATSSELFTLALDGSNAAPVRLNAGNVSREPSPSPDGQRFVFSVSQVDPSTGLPQHDLYLVRRDGLGMRRLTSLPGYEHQPQWSPDGTLILFRMAVDNTSRAHFAVVAPDGSGFRLLTTAIPNTMTDLRSPAWSQDGSRIAFIGAVNGQHKVWVMNA
ncbi:MAG TPA: Ig-like domain-containing protein, partial [Gemmatimonadaceae bacterium]|nr:Ig-like domain-containing protein [Gemmatimonadaceae bacterium]